MENKVLDILSYGQEGKKTLKDQKKKKDCFTQINFYKKETYLWI